VSGLSVPTEAFQQENICETLPFQGVDQSPWITVQEQAMEEHSQVQEQAVEGHSPEV
jgi:hypothetical protein